MTSEYSQQRDHDMPRPTFWSKLKLHASSGVVFGVTPCIMTLLSAPVAHANGQQELSFATIIVLGIVMGVTTALVVAYSTYRFNGYYTTTSMLLKTVVPLAFSIGIIAFYLTAIGDYYLLVASYYLLLFTWACINYLIMSPLIARRNQRM